MTDRPSQPVADLARRRQSCGFCALESLCLPASVTGSDLKRIDELVQQRLPMDRGKCLFHEGAPFHALFVVRTGSFKSYTVLPDGSAQVLGFHLPGEILGVDALDQERHQCTVEALERSSVCEVPFVRLHAVSAEVPGFQRQLYRVIGREFVREQQHTAMMGRKQAMERIAAFLKSLSDRRRALGLDHAVFTLSMSRHDIGNFLGLVVETVSRLFTKLATQGVIEVNNKELRILNFDALHALCGEVPDKHEAGCARA